MAVILAIVAFAGCTTVKTNAGKTLASVAVTVDASMKAWAALVVAGQTNPQQEANVKAYYARYQQAMVVARSAYAILATTGDATQWKIASTELINSQNAITGAVETVQAKALGK